MNETSKKFSWHETHVFATNGTVFPLTFRQVLEIVSSKLFLISLIIYLAVLAIAQTEIYGASVSLPFRAGYMLLNGSLTVATWLFLLATSSWLLAAFFRPLPIPTIVLHVSALTIINWLNRSVFGQLIGQPFMPEKDVFLLEVLEYSALLLAFEFLVVVFLLPRFDWVMELLPNRGSADDAKPQTISAGGTVVRIEDIHHLKSVEHYVEIATKDRTQLVRAALKDLIQQLDGVDGTQPHRSYWVPFGSIVGLCKEGGNVALHLTDGTTVPVSRGRRSELQDWLVRERQDG